MKGVMSMRKVKVDGERWKVVGKYGHASQKLGFFCQDLETRPPFFYRENLAIPFLDLSIYGIRCHDLPFYVSMLFHFLFPCIAIIIW